MRLLLDSTMTGFRFGHRPRSSPGLDAAGRRRCIDAVVLAAWSFLSWSCGGNVVGNSQGDASSGGAAGGGTTVDGSIVAPGVDGSSDASAYSGRCMISASSYDQSCAVDTDCTSVTSTNYCSVNCLCGGSAINLGAQAQFNEDVSKTPLGSGALGPAGCPCFSSPGPCCRNGQCSTTCFSPTDTLSACANAGGMCFLGDYTACGGQAPGPPNACAYSDEVCCVPGDGGVAGAGSDGGIPTISITSPSEGQTVAAVQPPHSPAWIVTIGFNVTNFTLWPAGSCPGGAANSTCGHVQVYVDGSACTPMGEPDNNMAFNGPNSIDAYLNSCPTVSGSHTVSLELHRDDGSPLDGPSGTVIRAQVTFTATGG